MKRYHTFTLTLGLGETGQEWDFQRIGTESEKGSVEKELAELRGRLAERENWIKRKKEIEAELNKVWTVGGELEGPSYVGQDEGGEGSEGNRYVKI